MHAWQISSFGIDNLEFTDRPEPEMGPGQVAIRVHAVSLNFRDLMMVKGLYNPKLKLPRIPCSDGAGEVLAVGPGVTSWKRGDRVAGIFMQNWIDGPPSPEKIRGALGGDIDGMLAEFAVFNENAVVAIPEHLSYQEAATLPCAAVTAWNALSAANIKPGDTVLVQGTGGVSVFALQFARLRGAKVLGISGNNDKLARALDFGLDAGVNYNEVPDWDRWCIEQTGGGVDLVVEVGGLGTLARSIRSLRVGGTIAQVGVLTGMELGEPLPIAAILHKQARIRGIYVGSRQDFIEMNNAISLTQLRPVGEDFSWQHAREVFKRLEEATHFGKLVMTIG